MYKEVRTYYCDVCGAEIIGYRGTVEIPSSLHGTDSIDMCEDCMKAFTKWRQKRREDRIQNTAFNDYNTEGE